MSYEVTAKLLGFDVDCRVEGMFICLTDLAMAFNATRLSKRQPAMQLSAVLASTGLAAYKTAAAVAWGIDESTMVRQVKSGGAKKNSRTYAHISIALYIAEVASPEFHAAIHKEIIEGRLLQFREQGGTEFKRLNKAIDLYLPGRENKDTNKGVYINAAKLIRAKITASDTPCVWDTASASQQQSRTEIEQTLVSMLRVGLVRDWEHLKDIIKGL
jgi:hypothetical protein